MSSETILNGTPASLPSADRVRALDAILFDLGDTLLHYDNPKASVLAQAALEPLHQRLVALGYRPPPLPKYIRGIKRAFLRAVAWSRLTRREVQLGEMLQRCHRRIGIRLSVKEMVDMATACLTPSLREFFDLDRRAVEVVRHLHDAGYKLGIVSNTVLPGSTIDALLADGGLIEFFPVRVYSSEARYMKPSSKIFQLALDALAIKATRTLFVGDHVVNDLKGPARMGMKTVLAVHGRTIPRTPRRPDHIIRSLTDLPAILESYAS